ncbi:protein FAM221B isoform X4 [Rattus norvegicus]|uniref:protein FAM221B isoform X4 n=1 Tax=Rattus norvegicus TaxID=10116 RepID=UPI002FD7BEED
MFAQPTETHSTLIPTRSKAALSHADDQKTSVARETTWYFCCSGDRSLPWVLEHILHLAPDLSYPLLPFVNSGQSPFAAGAQVSPNKHNTTRSLTYHLQSGSAAKPFPRSGSILPPQTQLKILTYGLGTTRPKPRGIYIGWRCPHYLWDCFRIGDESKCFCGHLLKEHQIISDLSVPCSVSQCRCLMFCFIPSRPEEVGEFWLKKRATFDPKAWRAQCRCKHTHEEHAATGSHPCRHRGCYCNSFESNFLCAACDRRWEEHETFFETEETKRRGKRPYGTNTAKNRHRPF